MVRGIGPTASKAGTEAGTIRPAPFDVRENWLSLSRVGRIFDHIDLRVARLAECEEFYTALLPMLGFVERVRIDGWLQFESAGPGPAAFFGVTEDPDHQPNRNRVAFWAESKESLDRLAKRLPVIGARNVDGPAFVDPTYYAVYFDDPSGNPLEICFRSKRFNEA